jgi:hypothetical protein
LSESPKWLLRSHRFACGTASLTPWREQSLLVKGDH